MASRTKRQRCIILKRTKLSEQDLILTMLADDGQQVRAIAKGARKPGARLAALSELFCECDLLLAHGKNLGIISEASLIEPHEVLRGDYDRVCAASAICECARFCCLPGVQDPFLYPLLSRSLKACEQAKDYAHLQLVVAAYVFKVLAHAGWRPQLSSCVACGDAAVSRFSARAGGALCESCAKTIEGAVRADEAQLSWLRALISSTFDKLLAANIDPPTANFLLWRAHEWAQVNLESRLRALEFMLAS